MVKSQTICAVDIHTTNQPQIAWCKEVARPAKKSVWLSRAAHEDGFVLASSKRIGRHFRAQEHFTDHFKHMSNEEAQEWATREANWRLGGATDTPRYADGPRLAHRTVVPHDPLFLLGTITTKLSTLKFHQLDSGRVIVDGIEYFPQNDSIFATSYQGNTMNFPL